MSESFPTLRQLRYFVALAQCGQYRRAAEQLGLSQPSLSQQIAALETVLGLRLVERGRRGVVLTPAGREALSHAQTVLDDVARLTSLSSAMAKGLTGTLHLGSTPTIGPYILPRLLKTLHAAHPELRLVARDGPPRDLLEDLGAGVHDVVLSQLPVRSTDFASVPLYREPLFLAVARDHRLAGRTRVTLADLEGEDMLSLGEAYALREQLSRLSAEAGARLRDDYVGTSLDALRQMVAMNMGVTVLPALYVRSELAEDDADVAIAPFKGGLYRSVGLIWRKATGQPAVLKRFRDLAETVVRDVFADDVMPLGR